MADAALQGLAGHAGAVQPNPFPAACPSVYHAVHVTASDPMHRRGHRVHRIKTTMRELEMSQHHPLRLEDPQRHNAAYYPWAITHVEPSVDMRGWNLSYNHGINTIFVQDESRMLHPTIGMELRLYHVHDYDAVDGVSVGGAMVMWNGRWVSAQADDMHATPQLLAGAGSS